MPYKRSNIGLHDSISYSEYIAYKGVAIFDSNIVYGYDVYKDELFVLSDDKYETKIFENDIVLQGFNIYTVKWNNDQYCYSLYNDDTVIAGLIKALWLYMK